MVTLTGPSAGFPTPLLSQLESTLRKATHDRIRGLAVDLVEGQVRIRGRFPCQHTRQLALHAALGLLPTELLSTEFIVGG